MGYGDGVLSAAVLLSSAKHSIPRHGNVKGHALYCSGCNGRFLLEVNFKIIIVVRLKLFC